jgi:hypothetical protein
MPSDGPPFTLQELADTLVTSFREVMEPAALPRPELVTVGETADPKLDILIFCPDCRNERGLRWNSHGVYFWGYDPENPDRPKRNSIRINHPEVRKTISYDAQAVREGLKKGTHGKQCLHCGARMSPLAA